VDEYRQVGGRSRQWKLDNNEAAELSTRGNVLKKKGEADQEGATIRTWKAKKNGFTDKKPSLNKRNCPKKGSKKFMDTKSPKKTLESEFQSGLAI